MICPFNTVATASHSERVRLVWDIAEVAKTPDGKALVQRHLAQVKEGPAFRGSQRGAQFLEYIVQQSALGHLEQLKERMLGIELFGRLPSYDTGEDAIVRVTASDVRRRLVKHYSQTENKVEFRISLPPGTYVPEFVRNEGYESAVVESVPVMEPEFPRRIEAVSIPEPTKSIPQTGLQSIRFSRFLAVIGGIALAIGLLLTLTHWHQSTFPAQAKVITRPSVPWDVMFDGTRSVLLIASDPNIEEVQHFAHQAISLSDYANGIYLPHNFGQFPPDLVPHMRDLLRGNKIAQVDGEIIGGLASLMPPGQRLMTVQSARSVHIHELQTNDNLIFLGSPRSNPWTIMYEPMLDFQFGYDPHTEREYIRNLHPTNGEASQYSVTSGDYQTGEAFATVTFLQRGSHGERILLIAGTNGEGTQTAGHLVTDPQHWEQAVRSCHLPSRSSNTSLQLLLHLNAVAGSTLDAKVIACHILSTDK
jgi:hypothetical protein